MKHNDDFEKWRQQHNKLAQYSIGLRLRKIQLADILFHQELLSELFKVNAQHRMRQLNEPLFLQDGRDWHSLHLVQAVCLSFPCYLRVKVPKSKHAVAAVSNVPHSFIHSSSARARSSSSTQFTSSSGQLLSFAPRFSQSERRGGEGRGDGRKSGHFKTGSDGKSSCLFHTFTSTPKCISICSTLTQQISKTRP